MTTVTLKDLLLTIPKASAVVIRTYEQELYRDMLSEIAPELPETLLDTQVLKVTAAWIRMDDDTTVPGLQIIVLTPHPIPNRAMLRDALDALDDEALGRLLTESGVNYMLEDAIGCDICRICRMRRGLAEHDECDYEDCMPAAEWLRLPGDREKIRKMVEAATRKEGER